MSLIDMALKAKNLKSLGDSWQGFDSIENINIIIGRNNTGKSSLIRLIELACDPP